MLIPSKSQLNSIIYFHPNGRLSVKQKVGCLSMAGSSWRATMASLVSSWHHWPIAMGNGLGSGTEMSTEGSGEVRRPTWGGSLPALPRLLLACGWKITSSGSVFSLISCESENATPLLSPPGFTPLIFPPLTCFEEWRLYPMMVLLRRKGSSYSKFPADDEHANVVQQLNSLLHISVSGCCPNNLSSLKLRNQFNPGFHLCF